MLFGKKSKKPTDYREALEQLCRSGDYEGIIDVVMNIPGNEKDYQALAPFLQAYLLHTIHDIFSFGQEVDMEKGCIMIPEWQVCLTPRIQELSDRSAVLDFYIYFAAWEKEIYECCAGMGSDLKQAIGMAVGSFAFAIMDGIGKMMNGESPRPLEAQFAGKGHRFQAHLSNLVGMGESPQTELDAYWEVLKDDIVKRLGNQTLCLVKIYGAKVNGQVTGECRIDDVQSDELSDKIARLVEKWDVGQFASHKQFILIRQAEETIQPYPYRGAEGQARFRETVLKAAGMFHESRTDELYDTLPERLAGEIGDATLASECYSFLPELCAQNAFPEFRYLETVDIAPFGGASVTCYKSQLADYWPMWRVLATAFQSGFFGEETDEIYRDLISVSAVAKIVMQMREKGAEPSGGMPLATLFQVEGDFEFR